MFDQAMADDSGDGVVLLVLWLAGGVSAAVIGRCSVAGAVIGRCCVCLLYTSPSPRD